MSALDLHGSPLRCHESGFVLVPILDRNCLVSIGGVSVKESRELWLDYSVKYFVNPMARVLGFNGKLVYRNKVIYDP